MHVAGAPENRQDGTRTAGSKHTTAQKTDAHLSPPHAHAQLSKTRPANDATRNASPTQKTRPKPKDRDPVKPGPSQARDAISPA